MDYKLLDDVNKMAMIDEYYCANVVEKTYECSTKLVYKKNGGFGMNYRYCKECYAKWDKDKQKPKVYKCLMQL